LLFYYVLCYLTFYLEKISAAQPKNVVKKESEANYFRYTPAQQGANFNSGAQQRIIKVVEKKADPFEPPKFKHKKVPTGPGSPPAPVLHSPPRKVTAQEQKDWIIPPCISNWKNTKGYTIPLDKRLAADGRGLQDVQINDKFALFSESLYTAARISREEVKQRNSLQHKMAEKEKMKKEENLRELAQKARENRAGFSNQQDSKSDESNSEYDSEEDSFSKMKERDELRRQKQKEREKEYRLSKMGSEARTKYLSRNDNRDISEKISLGLARPTASKDSLMDSRLFNQVEGIASGFRDDDGYNIYDKPLFSGSTANSIYKPTRNTDDYEDQEGVSNMLKQDRFGANLSSRGFKGADPSQSRSGPVEFQKEMSFADPFQLEEFSNELSKKRPAEDSDSNPNKR
jgi:SNW domain-containing protein 1